MNKDMDADEKIKELMKECGVSSIEELADKSIDTQYKKEEKKAIRRYNVKTTLVIMGIIIGFFVVSISCANFLFKVLDYFNIPKGLHDIISNACVFIVVCILAYIYERYNNKKRK